MTFKEIVSVSGKSGLFRILKGTHTGFVLESLDERKSKLVTMPDHKVSLLDEITVYTKSKDGSIPLESVLRKLKENHGQDPGVDASADDKALRAFMKSLVPDHDEARVYPSDIRKLLKWHSILTVHAPEVLTETTDEESKKE